MSFKRKVFIVYIAILIIYIFFVIKAFISIDSYSTVNTNADSIQTIIIDAGHGGDDGGAVANGIVEKDINLSISKKLYNIFKASGFNVKMTRNSDEMINDYGDSLRERKISDMKKRLGIFNSSENNVVISIHQNKFTQEQYFGTQIFYSTNNQKSLALANSVKSNFQALLQPDNEREIKPATRDIYLLYNSKVPSIIVECGFISNLNEANKLKQDSYQNEIAFTIYSGFLEYYNSE